MPTASWKTHHAGELQPQPPEQFADSLSGLIERVTFFNEDNGFAVLEVKAKGHRDHVTVVGSLPSVSAGEWVTAQGRWIQDREFGQQFRAEILNSTAPTTKEGIEKYLGAAWSKASGRCTRRSSPSVHAHVRRTQIAGANSHQPGQYHIDFP